MTERMEKILAAKAFVEHTLGDMIEKNYDESGPALVTAGTFTALIEAYRAIEIAEVGEKAAERKENSEAYWKGVMKR